MSQKIGSIGPAAPVHMFAAQSIEEFDALLNDAVIDLRNEFLRAGTVKLPTTIDKAKKNLLTAVVKKRAKQLLDIVETRKVVNDRIFKLKKQRSVPSRRKYVDDNVPGSTMTNKSLKKLYKILDKSMQDGNKIRKRKTVDGDNYHFSRAIIM